MKSHNITAVVDIQIFITFDFMLQYCFVLNQGLCIDVNDINMINQTRNLKKKSNDKE